MAAIPTQEATSSQVITVESLQGMSEAVKQLVQREKVVAVQEIQGRKKYARITLYGDQLYLHHLTDGQPPPPDVHLLNFQDIMRLVDPSSRRTFLDLHAAGSSLGQMIIHLTPDTEGARNFALLCSGEKGPSYANTKLFQVHHRSKRWEYVGGGDYEYNNGEGGKAVVEGLELGPQYERPWVAGTVRGFWGLGNTVSSQFFINTKDHTSGVCSPAFGIVEEGLEVLREAVRLYHDITKVTVHDCGTILSTS